MAATKARPIRPYPRIPALSFLPVFSPSDPLVRELCIQLANKNDLVPNLILRDQDGKLCDPRHKRELRDFQQLAWELYRLIKSMSPDCIVVMNQAFYQSRRNLGRICEPASWPTDVINGEDTLPPPERHNPPVTFQGKKFYLPMESWTPTGPPYKPMPPTNRTDGLILWRCCRVLPLRAGDGQEKKLP